MKTNIFKLLAAGTFFILGVFKASGQIRIIKGTISDESGAGISGAIITDPESQVKATANASGNYGIVVHIGTAALEIKALGFKTEKVSIHASSDILNVKMQADLLGIDEMSTTSQGVVKERKSLGYSTTQIAGSTFEMSGAQNVLSGIQGKSAGMYVSGSGGSAGSSIRVQLRGLTSLQSDNQPLIVWDGIPIDNSCLQNLDLNNRQLDFGNRLSDLNPDDIQSIEILKGPAAGVLYGIRGGNGVVMITSKSGVKSAANGKVNIQYHSSFSLERFLYFPKLQGKFGQGINGLPDSSAASSWGPVLDGQIRPWGQASGGVKNEKGYGAVDGNLEGFFNSGKTWNNHISVSGGNETNLFYLSIGDMTNSSTVPGMEYKRNTISARATSNISKNLSSVFSVNYSRINSKNPTMGTDFAFFDQLLRTPVDIPVSSFQNLSSPYNSIDGFYNKSATNPYYILNSSNSENTVNNFMGAGSLSYNHQNWLSATYRFGVNSYSDSRLSHEPKIDSAVGQNSGNSFRKGLFAVDEYRLTELNSDLFLQAKRKLVRNLKMDALIGYNLRQRKISGVHGQTDGLLNKDFYNLTNSLNRPVIFNTFADNSLSAAYADIGFVYSDFLYLDFLARLDMINWGQKENRNLFNPGVALAWIFSEQFKLPIWMSYGKARTSVSSVSRAPSEYSTMNIFNTSVIGKSYMDAMGGSWYGNDFGYQRGLRYGTNSLNPEITHGIEAGLELAFFKKERLGLDVTVYSSTTSRAIMHIPVAIPTDYSAIAINGGTFSNQGLELLIKGSPVISKEFKWNAGFNFFMNKNKVKSLPLDYVQLPMGSVGNIEMLAEAGKEMGSLYGFTELRTGDNKLVVDSATGLPLMTLNPVNFGSFLPKNIFTITNSFKYKNWELYVQIDRKNGGVFYSRNKELLEKLGAAETTLGINGDGDERAAEVIANSVYKSHNGQYVENTKVVTPFDYWTNRKGAGINVIDGSFTKLREVSLIYSVPPDWLKRSAFGSVSVGISGRNLWLWTPDSNKFTDPETSSFGTSNLQGFQMGSLPGLRSYTLHLKVSF